MYGTSAVQQFLEKLDLWKLLGRLHLDFISLEDMVIRLSQNRFTQYTYGSCSTQFGRQVYAVHNMEDEMITEDTQDESRL